MKICGFYSTENLFLLGSGLLGRALLGSRLLGRALLGSRLLGGRLLSGRLLGRALLSSRLHFEKVHKLSEGVESISQLE